MKVWRTGELVRITFHRLTVDGVVALASANGKSVFLSFEALLGGYAGQMPVMWDEETDTFQDLVNRELVVLVPR